MNDYTIFYKRQLPVEGSWGRNDHWDIFISSYIPADRVQQVFAKANAKEKRWLIFPEYDLPIDKYPLQTPFVQNACDESEFVSLFWDTLPDDASTMRICIDITGFIRPYLIFLIRWLYAKGVRRFDAIYSEPSKYGERELTEFSGDIVKEVRQVALCEGIHSTDNAKDLLIIGAGYEDNLISHVAESKAKATKLQLVGFPSLRADMYQENVLRIRRADESLGASVHDEVRTFFAPANDPFVAASALSEMVRDWDSRHGISNLYLCPLSTKAHVLGFTLYFLTECRGRAASIIYPFEERHSPNSSEGVARIWKYTVELPTA